MHIGDQTQFFFAGLSDRLVRLMDDTDVGNGTDIADALTVALKLDIRISGTKSAGVRLNALTDDELFDLAFDLGWTLKTESSEFTLPFGTVVKSSRPGGLTIGGETWVLDADRPGLHPLETTRRDAHGSNLELLHQHIRRLTRNSPCRRIGLPSAVFVVDNSDRHLLQFPPFDEAGGVVLQRSPHCTDAPRFCAALPHQVFAFAESIVKDMKVLWKRRREIAATTTTARTLVEGAAAAHDASVQLVAIDLHLQRDKAELDLYVHYMATDEAMRIGPVLDYLPASRRFVAENYKPPYGVTGRKKEFKQLEARGAHGWIDGMAAAVVAAAPAGGATVLAALATEYEAQVEFETCGGPLYATLFWRDGTITTEISMAGRLDWYGDRLELYGVSVPETIRVGITGQTVDTLVELPFPCPLLIERVEHFRGKTRLTLEVPRKLVNFWTGSMWVDASMED